MWSCPPPSPAAAASVPRRHTPLEQTGTVPYTVDEADAALAGPGTEGVQELAAHEELSLRRGGGFAVWVSGIMLSEQTLLNAAVLTVDATSTSRALAGIVFNVLLIARAPLQLFQAIQTSLLAAPDGPRGDRRARCLRARDPHHGPRDRGLRRRGRARTACRRVPFALRHVFFGQNYDYGRVGLALIGVGMGLHLTSGALNQAALARDRARAAAGCWLLAAVAFVVWMLIAERSPTSCCAPRSATRARPRCSPPRWRCSTARARRAARAAQPKQRYSASIEAAIAA